MSDIENKRATEYAQNLSHELLTPLAVIRSKAELLLQSKDLSKEDMKNIDVILKTVERMSRLNKALILLSKIDSEVYQDIEELDVNEIVSDSLEKFEDQIRFRSLQIRYQKKDPSALKSNRNLFEILITNLIKNAVFHNIDSGKILITSDNKSFQIENTTNQTASEDLYTRFVSQGNDKDSIGLGLSIAKKICDFLGYKIHHELADNRFVMTVHFN
ncbi:MAG: HAMP domain-containing histidine kinase [Crocinitomicaceae bacterium]|nr:HAMP domain-containing histidine kinase [Crocinitomicaceae bacterium]